MYIFRDILFDHSELSSLKSLLAVLSVPRTFNRANSEAYAGTDGSSPDKVMPSPSLMMAPASTPWTPSQIEPFLQRIGPTQPVNGTSEILMRVVARIVAHIISPVTEFFFVTSH